MSNTGIKVSLTDNNNKLHVHVLEDLTVSSTVVQLKSEAMIKHNLRANGMDACYKGVILDDSATLSSYGITPSSVVHVICREPEVDISEYEPVTEKELKELLGMFRCLATKSILKQVLRKLGYKDLLSLSIVKLEAVRKDPVAISMLKHEELISKLVCSASVRRCIDKCPVLATAVYKIFATSENGEPPLFAQIVPGLSSSSRMDYFTHNLNNMRMDQNDEDEDDDEYDSDDSAVMSSGISPIGNFRPGSFLIPSINIGRMAPSSSTQNANAASTQQASNGSADQQQRGAITAEMLSQALQQASSASTTPTLPTNPLGPVPNVNYRNLSELRRLGFTNDGYNVQALELANGNIEEAVNILLSGVMDDEN